MRKISDIFAPEFEKIIADTLKTVSDPIFVVSGLSDYIDFFKYEDHIADVSTFDEEGNADFFDKKWFKKIFGVVSTASSYTILSHQQYAYMMEYLNVDFFSDRAFIVFDNLRSLYPLHSTDYVEVTSGENQDARSPQMPVYQTEQFKIGDKYYYSLKHHDESATLMPFFKNKLPLSQSTFTYTNNEVVDIATNPYAIDYFINECLEARDFNKKYVIKSYVKQPLNTRINDTLEKANKVLSLFGGGIYLQKEETIKREYDASQDALRLLHKYWGENASFRDINIYENPDYGSTTIPISQGQIVDTIIQEFKTGHDGVVPRDVFITAPTGAGKSLIFQLPAFYAAEQGDLTIVISPLKALMTDQVENLRRERGYQKVAYINSDLNFIDREEIIRRCKEGDIDILYLSPESLLSYNINYFIGERNLGLVIIDEAHLITTWGRDFRVDYWFLGNHLNKIRKYGNYTFPLVALTATAVYGGINDMVFDSISSLYMHDPHKFIGEVIRNDIEFVIDTHDDYPLGSYDTNKEEETVKFIEGIDEIGCKTIVYAPFKRHIDRLWSKAEERKNGMAVTYHSGISSDSQKDAYTRFRTNQTKVMICTKAFGMGIDIPDIQCVYHHAPSGLLPDYIQEIGRAARKKDIHGYAAITFSQSDLRYSKQLHGISSLKTFQLREVLKKIYNYFVVNGKKRNMLISASDFSYIFDANDDITQKVSTALMMIEKDYLIKYRFNVLIARPKTLFSQVFARVNSVSLSRLKDLYSDCFSEMNWTYGDFHFIQLNLDKIWERHFSDSSFPKIKADFYNLKFLNNQGIELMPLLKMTFFLEVAYNDALSRFEKVIQALAGVIASFRRRNAFFTEKEFKEELTKILGDSTNVEKLASFALATYSGSQVSTGNLENDVFLQRRRSGFFEEYQVFNSNYNAKFAQLRNQFAKIFDSETSECTRFVSIKESSLPNYMRLGGLLEILNLGSFVSQGGEDPKLFIRINDLRRIMKDSVDVRYRNTILESVKDRYKSSCEIFDHFFTRYFDNDTRWKIIEDFFLGISTDDLLAKYKGGTRNRVDIVKYIKDNIQFHEDEYAEIDRESFMDEFKIRPGAYYHNDSLLTIGRRTMKISKWVTEDPVLLHRTIVQNNVAIEKDYYKVLMSKLQVLHKEYYRDIMGLRLYISFPGYNKPIMASAALSNDPVAFYKWYRKNNHVVTITDAEFKSLLLQVERLKPNALLKAHKQLINKKND
ncbi:MAG: DEAD/DEAH box helicase [Muribaculum sp.]|nr:DEAD/DEAH box helicase [Muribaculum sp.]